MKKFRFGISRLFRFYFVSHDFKAEVKQLVEKSFESTLDEVFFAANKTCL